MKQDFLEKIQVQKTVYSVLDSFYQMLETKHLN